jgi:hypothetical protein
MGEMRKRIKKRLDAEGIEIPFPHQTVYWGDDQAPFRPDVGGDIVHGSAPVAKPEPSSVAAVQPSRPTPTTASPAAGSLDDEVLTPERREELLADIAMATASRIADSNKDIQSRTLLVDTSEGE